MNVILRISMMAKDDLGPAQSRYRLSLIARASWRHGSCSLARLVCYHQPLRSYCHLVAQELLLACLETEEEQP